MRLVLPWKRDERAAGFDHQRFAVLHGQARVAGTPVSVSVVLDCLAAGMRGSEILAEYPSLTAAGIRTAGSFGA